MRRLFLSGLCLFAGFGRAEVRLPAVIGDHMVLQREAAARIWGWADPGEAVTVRLAGQEASVTANADGKWQVFLRPMSAGGPHELTVASSNTVTVRDVLVGEVWVASGQSNMAMTVSRSNNAEAEVRVANLPRIRFFTVPSTVANAPADDVKASWKVCSPETAGAFSATAFFTVRELEKLYNVPFGVLQSAVGGTPAEAWTPRRALEEEPRLLPLLVRWSRALELYPVAARRYARALEAWKRGERKGPAPQPPQGPGHRNTPGGLYNGMIAPLAPYTIRGALWYQGENNASTGHGDLYNRLLETLIRSWREAWGQGDFPFFWVQLPNFIHKANPSHWPEVQDGMRQALELVNTGMVVAIDIGDPNNIHPTNKQEVGRRMARVARAVAYGEKITWSGPLLERVTTEPGGALRVWFRQAGTGLKTRDGGPVKAFEVAGANGQFMPAGARVDGTTVVVEARPGAAQIRYAWGGNPETNLYNSEDLPASPFLVKAP